MSTPLTLADCHALDRDDPLRALSPEGDVLTPPWPRLVIGTGRMSVAPVAAIGAASASMLCSLRWALSEKFSLMRLIRFMIDP